MLISRVCAHLTHKFLREIRRSVGGSRGASRGARRQVVARSLAEWRAEEEVVDDITCVIVYFQHYQVPEEQHPPGNRAAPPRK